jgi:hypothetical protein
VFFENKNRMFITSYQADPRPVVAAS